MVTVSGTDATGKHPDDLLTVKEAADAIYCTAGSLYRAVKEHRIAHTLVLGQIRIHRSDANTYGERMGQANGWAQRGYVHCPPDRKSAICAIARLCLHRKPTQIKPWPKSSRNVYLFRFADAPAFGDRILKLADLNPQPYPIDAHTRETLECRKIWREVEMLQALKEAGLTVPPVEFSEEDVIVKRGHNFTKCLSTWPFFIAPRVAGVPLSDTIKTRPMWMRTRWEQAGRFVAELAPVAPSSLSEPYRYAANPATLLRRLEEARSRFADNGLLRPPFIRILNEAEPLLRQEPTHLIHTSYGPRRIIANDNAFHVIDWEDVDKGSSLEMLASIIGSTRSFHRAEGNDELIAWMVAGYESLQPLDDQARHELHVREMYNHLLNISAMLLFKMWNPPLVRYAHNLTSLVEQYTYL